MFERSQQESRQYRGESFALKAHVRHVVDCADSYVRTNVQVFEAVNSRDYLS